MFTNITLLKGLSFGNAPAPDSASASNYSELAHPEDAAKAILQPELLELYRFWREKTESLGRLPARTDFTPFELKKLLPHILLVDVINDAGGFEFKFRLCGTKIVEGWGADLTGYSTKNVNIPEPILTRTSQLVDTQIPYYAANIQAFWAPKSFQHYSILGLPLSADGTSVNMLLYGIIFHPKEEKNT